MIASVFQPIEELVRGKKFILQNSTVLTTKSRLNLEKRKSRMEIDLNGIWSLNRSEGFEEYLMETGKSLHKINIQ